MLTTVAASPSAVIALGSVINDAVPGVTSTDASPAGWLVAPGAGASTVVTPGTPLLAGPAAPIDYFRDGTLIETIDFGSTEVGYLGDTVQASSVWAVNTGTTPITSLGFAASGSPGLKIVSDQCASRTIAGGDACVVWVAFTPTQEGAYLGALTLQFEGFAPRELPVTGTGLPGFPTPVDGGSPYTLMSLGSYTSSDTGTPTSLIGGYNAGYVLCGEFSQCLSTYWISGPNESFTLDYRFRLPESTWVTEVTGDLFLGDPQGSMNFADLTEVQIPGGVKNNWYRVTVVREGDVIDKYVDGVLVSSSAMTGLALSSGAMYLMPMTSNYRNNEYEAMSLVRGAAVRP
jgi:hypothetical protein